MTGNHKLTGILLMAGSMAVFALLAPFVYTQINWTIIAAGLVVFARERILGRETSLPAPGWKRRRHYASV